MILTLEQTLILTLINIVAIGFGGYALYRCGRIYQQIIQQKKENLELYAKIITRMDKMEKVTDSQNNESNKESKSEK